MELFLGGAMWPMGLLSYFIFILTLFSYLPSMHRYEFILNYEVFVISFSDF